MFQPETFPSRQESVRVPEHLVQVALMKQWALEQEFSFDNNNELVEAWISKGLAAKFREYSEMHSDELNTVDIEDEDILHNTLVRIDAETLH